MKEIGELTVTQIRIYKADVLPYTTLVVGPNPEALKARFSFRSFQQEPNGELNFSAGIFVAGSVQIPILTLTIDPRRVVIRVHGSSADAVTAYSAVWEVFRTLSPHGAAFEDRPLTKSDETICVATLDIGLDKLVSPGLMKLLTTEGKAAMTNSNAIPKAVELQSIVLTVRYDPADKTLIDRGITIGNKLVTFQPRMGTLSGENRFYFSSPTDSETHLSLLSSIEKALLK